MTIQVQAVEAAIKKHKDADWQVEDNELTGPTTARAPSGLRARARLALAGGGRKGCQSEI